MKSQTHLIFKLEEKQLPDYEECNNWLGFNQIEIIQFNYDGKGNALIIEDGNFSYYHPDDLGIVLFSGWYSLIKD